MTTITDRQTGRLRLPGEDDRCSAHRGYLRTTANAANSAIRRSYSPGIWRNVANPRYPVKIATLPAIDGNTLWGQTFSPSGQVLATGCHGGTEAGARPAIRACGAGQPPGSRSKAGQHQTPQPDDQRGPMSASNPAPGTRRRPVSASPSVFC